MRKAFLYIILALLLSVSCTQKEPATYMLRPHEELPKEIESDKNFTKIFLAGTIDMGNSRDWQMELYDRFSKIDGRTSFSIPVRNTGTHHVPGRWTIRSDGNWIIWKKRI